MSREVLVAIHTTAGIAGLVAGLAVFKPPHSKSHRRWWRIGYGLLLIALVASLIAMIIVDWPDLPTGARVTFAGLAVLGLVMVVRIYLAHRLAGETTDRAAARRYVGHVYFTYVSLWVGLAIIPALRSETPGLWLPVAIIGVLAVGFLLLHLYESRIGLRAES